MTRKYVQRVSNVSGELKICKSVEKVTGSRGEGESGQD